jgi:FAD/FMN-containing dehydrogenase
MIGGNVASNAGGLRLTRYGSLHGSVLGLEVVLADGTVLDLRSSLRKDNTGLHLRNLFIGSEGTLGIITKVNVLTPVRPTSVQTALLVCNTFDDVLNAIQCARLNAAEVISALEFIDAPTMAFVLKHTPQARAVFNADSDALAVTDEQAAAGGPFYLLVETHGSNAEHDAAKLDAFVADAAGERGVVNDGVVAQTQAQMKNMWLLREGIAPALRSAGHVWKYDVSVPLANMYEIGGWSECLCCCRAVCV